MRSGEPKNLPKILSTVNLMAMFYCWESTYFDVGLLLTKLRTLTARHPWPKSACDYRVLGAGKDQNLTFLTGGGAGDKFYRLPAQDGHACEACRLNHGTPGGEDHPHQPYPTPPDEEVETGPEMRLYTQCLEDVSVQALEGLATKMTRV